MGWLIDYRLKVKPDLLAADIQAIRQNLGAWHAGFCYAGEAFQCRWYQHEEDMRLLSLEYPDRIFRLHGVEEDGKHWYEYYVNGLMQHCIGMMSYQPFDPWLLR